MVNYNNALSDIRDKNDRRKHKLRSFLYSFFKRQRKQIRRLGDESKDIYVDIHEPITVIIFTATLFFCVTDAILTLFIISEGGHTSAALCFHPRHGRADLFRSRVCVSRSM